METIDLGALNQKFFEPMEEGCFESWVYWLSIALFEGNNIDNFRKGQGKYIFDVEMKVNGKEVQFSHVIRKLHQTFEAKIAEWGKQLIERHVGNPLDEIDDMLDELKTGLEARMAAILERHSPEEIRRRLAERHRLATGGSAHQV